MREEHCFTNKTIVLFRFLIMSDIPSDLIVFTYVWFYSKNQRTRREIEERYAKLGKRLYHKAIAPPRVIFWNLRGDVRECPYPLNQD